MTEDQKNIGTVSFLGPIKVINSEGLNCTPTGLFRQALFAVLALSRNGERSRSFLQYLLWPSRDAVRGAGSLRNALSVLRKELVSFGPNFITADDQVVRLDLERVTIDVLQIQDGHQAPPGRLPELLDGLSLRGTDSSEFDDWLRIERSYWADQCIKAKAAALHMPDALPQTATIQRNSVSVARGPLVVRFASNSAMNPALDHLQHAFRSRLAAAIPHQVLFEDSALAQLPHLSVDIQLHGAGEQRLLLVRADNLSNQQELSVATANIDMSATLVGDIKGAASNVLNMIIDQIAVETPYLLSSASNLTNVANEVLNLAFSNGDNRFSRAHAIISAEKQCNDDALLDTLATYLETFSVGENPLDGEASDEQVDAAVASSRNLNDSVAPALAKSLVGYSLDFLAADSMAADKLLVASVEEAPSSAIAWDHLAMFQFRKGNYAVASQAAQRAVSLGRGSPLLPSFETSLCLAASMNGDHKRAHFYGERALAGNAGFQDVGIFCLSSLGHLDDWANAAILRDTIEKLDTSISIDRIAARSEVRMLPDARKMLLTGLRLAGLRSS
ncbi:MAG: hypothetical protein ABJL72_12285 [Roseobacter sp.]